MTVYKTLRIGRGGKKLERWMIDVVHHSTVGVETRVRRVATIQSKREAEREEREILAQLAAGTWGTKPIEQANNGVVSSTPAETFAVFANRWIETYATVHNKPSEIATKRTLLRVHLVPAFGECALDEVTLVRIEEYKARKIREELSPKSINNHLTVLRKLLCTAQEWGVLANVPRIRWLKTREPEYRFLDFDESERLLVSADSSWQTMLLVALRAGLRLGELLALRWVDVDLKGGRLIVRQSRTMGITTTPKGGRKREVPISEETARALAQHKHLRGELVFCRSDGKPLTKGETKWPLWSACKRANIDRIGWHVLRHTFASQLVMRGATLKAVQELLGHATIDVTMRYAHLAPEARRETVRLLDGPGRGTPTALRSVSGVP